MLDVQNGPAVNPSDELNTKTLIKQKLQAATAAAKALRSLSYSSSARRDLYLAGGVPLLTRLTLSIGGLQRDSYNQLSTLNQSHQHPTPSITSPSTGTRVVTNTKSR